MLCPSCGSRDFRRSHRRGFLDKIRAWRGLWPYRCRDCGRRFALKARDQTAEDTSGPPIRPNKEKATAQVMVRANSPEQLEDVLTVLGNAISAFKTDGSERLKAGSERHDNRRSRPNEI